MRSVPQRPVVLLSYFTLRDLGNLLDDVRRTGIAKQADVYIGSYGANPRTANAVHEEGTRYLSARREAGLREFAVFNFRFGNASPQGDERCSTGCRAGFHSVTASIPPTGDEESRAIAHIKSTGRKLGGRGSTMRTALHRLPLLGSSSLVRDQEQIVARARTGEGTP